jgi:hypothetical protein
MYFTKLAISGVISGVVYYQLFGVILKVILEVTFGAIFGDDFESDFGSDLERFWGVIFGISWISGSNTLDSSIQGQFSRSLI